MLQHQFVIPQQLPGQGNFIVHPHINTTGFSEISKDYYANSRIQEDIQRRTVRSSSEPEMYRFDSRQYKRLRSENQEQLPINFVDGTDVVESQTRVITPTIIAGGVPPLVQAKNCLQALVSLNGSLAPIAMINPILTPTFIARSYCPEPAGNFRADIPLEEKSKNPYELIKKEHDMHEELKQPEYSVSSPIKPAPTLIQIQNQPEPQNVSLRKEDVLEQPNREATPKLALATENQAEKTSERKIGTLTIEERKVKVQKYKEKRGKRTWIKKISHESRKRVANSRLRVKGRFVTKNQAFMILGDKADHLIDNEILRTLIKKERYPIATLVDNIKIRNAQHLFNVANEDTIQIKNREEIEEQLKNLQKNKVEIIENQKMKMQVLKKDSGEQLVEIKIETSAKNIDPKIVQKRIDEKGPKTFNVSFQFKEPMQQ